MTRTCKSCKLDRPLSEYREYRASNGRSYRPWKCMGCESTAKNLYYREKRLDPEWKLLDRVRRYGISTDFYLELLESQGGLCAICHSELTSPYIDHDHSCCPDINKGTRGCGGCVRGLVCSGCNLMLGIVNDDTEVLFRAIRYLEKFS